MAITRVEVMEHIASYLQHRLSLADLVDWAESALMDAEICDDGFEVIRHSLARLGVADVRQFGLTWDDCAKMLQDLGFVAHVDIVAA